MLYRLIDLLWLCIILAFSFGLAWFFPVQKIHTAPIDLLPIFLVFSFFTIFLADRAMERKHALAKSIALELSRLRRVGHLSETYTDELWKQHVHDALISYQEILAGNFLAYTDALKRFRALSHLIYTYEPKTRHEEIVMQDLLATLRDLALERQHIEHALLRRLSYSSWFFVTVITVLATALLLLEPRETLVAQFAIGAGITGILLSVEFLYRFDRFTNRELSEYQTMYRMNIPRMKE